MMDEPLTLQDTKTELPTPSGLWWRRFMIRLQAWEYWPVYIFNIPVLFIWWWNAIKARHLFFFTSTNPGIPTGGFFGESKSDILNQLPVGFKPMMVLIRANTSDPMIEKIVADAGLSYPLIAKPEIGERGWLISKIHSLGELKTYLREHPIDIILQTFIDYPIELSIMVYQMADNSTGGVTSICEKLFLQVVGDGRSTLGELILMQDRAVLQFEKLAAKFGHRWNEVIPGGQTMILEPIGNHSRGTMFLDRNQQIDDQIAKTMISLLRSMPGVYYGRFDMKVGSWASLREGKEIMILEFNGASSDPAHIYQPGYSLLKAYRDMAFHWDLMYRIAKQNRREGHKPMTFKQIISALITYFRYKRTN